MWEETYYDEFPCDSLCYREHYCFYIHHHLWGTWLVWDHQSLFWPDFSWSLDPQMSYELGLAHQGCLGHLACPHALVCWNFGCLSFWWCRPSSFQFYSCCPIETNGGTVEKQVRNFQFQHKTKTKSTRKWHTNIIIIEL